MTNASIKVIFDTNVWISFLIGKRLSLVKNYISDGQIIIVTTEQLLREIKLVTGREKLKKYFPKESVKELIELLETISENVEIQPKHLCLLSNAACHAASGRLLLRWRRHLRLGLHADFVHQRSEQRHHSVDFLHVKF